MRAAIRDACVTANNTPHNLSGQGMRSGRFFTFFALGLFLYFGYCISPYAHAEIVTLNGIKTEVYFSPYGGAEQAIVRAIDKAQRDIRVLAYSFTSQPIEDALVRAAKRNVSVKIILDKSQRNGKGSRLQSLFDSGIPVYIDKSHAIAHNKVIIIDRKRVITGSFNFTAAAEKRNAENLLILHSRNLAREYLKDFQEHLEHAQKVEGKSGTNRVNTSPHAR